MEPVALFIMWIGQSCFVVQTSGTKILMDPPPPRMGYAATPIAADIVTVSHEHGDHNYVELAQGSPVVLRGLTPGGKDWAPIDYANKDVKITAFPSYHDDADGGKRGKNALFLIETGGLRVLHCGDLGHRLPDETVGKLGRVDILLICVGGFYTIDAAGARDVIGQLKPRVVIPMHFKTGVPNPPPIEGVEAFLAGWDDVRRSKEPRVGFTSDLAGYPEGKTAIVVLPPQLAN